jgi:hypothetical protein
MAQLSTSVYLGNKTNSVFRTRHFGVALLKSPRFKKRATKARRRQYVDYSSVNTNCFRLFFTVKQSQLYLPFLAIDGKGIQVGDVWTKVEAKCHA